MGFFEKMQKLEQETKEKKEKFKETKEKKGIFKAMWNAEMETADKRMVTIELEYIGGHPDFKPGKTVKVHKTKNGKVSFDTMLSNVEGNIVDYSWGEKSKRSAGKAAAGAIVGGVLTSGVGAIAGAAIGGRKKDNSILYISLDENGRMYHLQFRADQKKYNEFLKKVL